MLYNRLIWITLSLAIAVTTGCAEVGDGEPAGTTVLPTDTTLNLYCKDMGVYPDSCVSDDPNNPFARVSITENVYTEDENGDRVLVSESNKLELAEGCPSGKSLFYLWATALARSPSGENQFMTADALHQLYTEGGSETARQQAIKAYRATLDFFFDSATYFVVDYLPEEPTYPVMLKDLVGARMYDPSQANLDPLYDAPEFGTEALGEWGYALTVVLEYEYDQAGNVIGIQEKRIVSRIE